MSSDFRFISFGARFGTGTCELCGEQIKVGDSIGYDEEEDLVHEDCHYEWNPSDHVEPRTFTFEP